MAKPRARHPGAAGPTISIVLIDDNRLVRDGLAALIREQPGFVVLAASADADEALRKVREVRPAIVLLDLSLEGSDCLEVVARLRQETPEAKIIVMGLSSVHDDVADFVRAGASGFLMKDSPFEVFLSTVRAVANGTQALQPELADSLFGQVARKAARRNPSAPLASVRLTQRERDIINLVSDGLSNGEIAARLGIGLHAVKSQLQNVLEKLSLHSRLEVAGFTAQS